MGRKNYFSQFTIAEQQQALDLRKRLDAAATAKKAAEELNVATSHRLSAVRYFPEVLQQPGIAPELAGQMREVFDRYKKQQDENATRGRADYVAAEAEMATLSPLLQQNADAVTAVIHFLSGNQVPAEVDRDCPEPDALIDGLAGYEALVKRELVETEALLTERRPELLRGYQMSVARQTLEFAGAGQEVAAAADEMRAARIILRNLRQSATEG